jgi:hypothetical protein
VSRGNSAQRRCVVTAFIRLYGFVPTGAGVITDQLLREAVLPGLHEKSGLRHAYAGRTSGGDAGHRLVASIWEKPDDEGAPPPELTSLFSFERLAEVEDLTLEVIPLAVALPFALPDEPRILRVFRGQTRPGELEAYIQAARDGSYEDVLTQHGPAGLFLGAQPPDRFVSVSVWTAWENIEAATGGNVREPIAIKHSQPLVKANAVHYEIVPGSIGGPAVP